MNDLGRRELGDAYGGPFEQAGLEAALGALITLQSVEDAAIPPYTGGRLRDELGIFSDWFADGLMETSLPAAIEPVFQHLVERMVRQQQCCVHRDYHCRNLLFDPDTGRLGIVDFQDALVGPVSYDLASLLHDCYHRFSDEDVARWLGWYLNRTPLELEPGTFATDVAMTAVQRQLKAVGIFARLMLRDGRTTHLKHILPVLESLTDLSHREPELAPLAVWLDRLEHGEVQARIEALSGRAAAPA
jgi:aminoglycoside/choline kinase family phosphotransferase